MNGISVFQNGDAVHSDFLKYSPNELHTPPDGALIANCIISSCCIKTPLGA
jgi:hypothetical protein